MDSISNVRNVELVSHNMAQQEIRRDRLEIILNMLSQASGNSVKKTHFLYGSRINHHQLVRHMSYMLDLGFLKQIENGEYVTTAKGQLLLNMFTHILNKEQLV